MILAFTFVFIVYRIVCYVFERLFKPSGTGPNVLRPYVYTFNNKAISSDRRYLWQIATAEFNHTHLAWDSDTRIGIISSSATDSKRIQARQNRSVWSGHGRTNFWTWSHFFKIQNKTVNFLEPKLYIYNKKATSSNRKIATNCDSGI